MSTGIAHVSLSDLSALKRIRGDLFCTTNHDAVLSRSEAFHGYIQNRFVAPTAPHSYKETTIGQTET
ncbi:hypothetical protein TNCV_5092031 [Trichonephila clavipes]|nr:hypothetical protein TNCV_5092031 [Trichonephila clavipes]